MNNRLLETFKSVLPAVDFWSLRYVNTDYQQIMVRQNRTEPLTLNQSQGVHITLLQNGGIGYGATSDLTSNGLQLAIEQASRWAKYSSACGLIDTSQYPRPSESGQWQSPVEQDWDSLTVADKITLLTDINHALRSDDAIVDWWASLENIQTTSILFTEDVTIEQNFSQLTSMLSALANRGIESQQRSYGIEFSAQNGLEQLARIEFAEQASRISQQALQLLDAPNCPNSKRSLVLMPSQMTMQIHESIGHPLELDRILGDERNYAGTSFVTEDMFGTYQYGSDLLNISYDPRDPQQIASYGFDDEGIPARHEYLIRNGVLLRPLAGHLSQQRGNQPGVANSRACDWNRPAIDRMANINLEPGNSTLEEIIANTESGILMDTNRSWSIDDSRNKFQFGCEYAQLIENGELTTVVKNPNYRGISSHFWRNLSAVCNASTYQALGVPTCGKGEPNQAIQVGHASPVCQFQNVDVFGGG
ncbi:MAG: TldD/PmbA family protein [Gammaproteobacteria bacterium]|nr:TldD/PmbA family protein [Gammaproteobacteria bacterium]